ncbi:hypothetical protein M8542_10240 [Amycolatopsis sp. OK19-0408]|uniref:STAS domain-containing protein n=1 Tax=Amycolatopsis iheyensis TaxID=2945988 RepID=A0A9X2N6F3_9PSEU|nr:hypothetical protein [Amycolatopsis iheyensis]MCR6483196.1 hypothetical protein [Amycolatopsis iheyensis]
MTSDIEVVPVTAEQAFVLQLSGSLTAGTAERAAGKLADATVVLPPPSLNVLDLRGLELLSAAGVGQALARVVAATTVIVPHARLVGITLRDPGGRFFTPIDAWARPPRTGPPTPSSRTLPKPRRGRSSRPWRPRTV